MTTRPVSSWLVLMAVAVLAMLPADGRALPAPGEDDAVLSELSLEQLLEVRITSAARKEQQVWESATAAYVISGDQIRQAGVTNLPEALRLAPGVNVAQIDGNQWAISIRGFSDLYANSLLVMVDGRTVYTPFFGGVYWGLQSLAIENVDRIEVIRGPGGALWGANASNGVINIITKPAAETQGTLITAWGGTADRGMMTSHGFAVGEELAVRVYGKRDDCGGYAFGDGAPAHDQWRQAQGGFRADWQDPGGHDALTLQGDWYQAEGGQTVWQTSPAPPYNFAADDDLDPKNLNMLARWQHDFGNRADATLQVYVDDLEFPTAPASLRQRTLDLDLRHHFFWGERHEFVWGGGFRQVRDNIDGSFTLSLDPEREAFGLFNAFVQDEIALLPDRFYLTLGSKLEYQDLGSLGSNLQPNLRWRYHFTDQMVWGAVSRAVRVPSRCAFDQRLNVFVLPFPPRIVDLEGADGLGAEQLTAYELGYRNRLLPTLTVDGAGFFNRYTDLLGVVAGTPYPDPASNYRIMPNEFTNAFGADAYGAELALLWQPIGRWSLRTGYSWLRIFVDTPESVAAGLSAERYEERDSQHQVFLASKTEISRAVEFDTLFYYFTERFADDPARRVPAYGRLDLRLGWRPRPDLELALAVRNLLDDEHPEIRDDLQGIEGTIPVEIPRTVVVKLSWKL